MDPECSVIDNIEKLEKAEKAMQTAEFFVRGGNTASASFYYEMARKLCPGSRYEEMAAAGLNQLTATAQTKADAEEQESKPSRIKSVKPREPKASPQEALEKRLKAPINANYYDVSLTTVLEDFRSHGLNIVLDYPALEQEGANLYRPVFLTLDNVSVKSALNLVLKQVRLACKVEDEVVVITTPAGARGKPTIRTYGVTKLLDRMDNLGRKGVFIPATEEMVPEAALIRFITGTVDPNSWTECGGMGVIEYFPVGHALVVVQPPDVQEQVAELLEALEQMAKEDKEAPQNPFPGCEEQSTCPPPVPSKEAGSQLETRVHELLEACQRAYMLGKYGEAESLARQAIDVDPAAVSDHPLVKKSELFMKINRAKRKKPAAPDAPPPLPMRHPDLPPVDHSLVPAMEKILSGTGFEIEIVTPSATEEQEIPPPPSSEVQHLDLPLPKLELSIKAAASEPAECDCCNAVNKLMEAVGAAACTEVEGQPGCTRGCCQVFLGCFKFKMEWRKDGRGSITLDIHGPEEPQVQPECP